MGLNKRKIELFNSDVEVGMRALLIINNVKGSIDLDRLLVYDYLCLHTYDFGGPESLHPAIPNRNVELVIKSERISKGLRLLITKELINVRLLKKGIYYSKNKLTNSFLNYVKSSYRYDYEIRVKWVLDNFSSLSDNKLKLFVEENMGKWVNEFSTETEAFNEL
ncbi:MAG: ABC-three component system middle component 2 [Algibacter sp.]